MKVTFIHKNGREQVMDERYAEILSKLRRGEYQTRSMIAYFPHSPVSNGTYTDKEIEPDGIDQMDVDSLKEVAKGMGLKIHHRAGRDKIIAAIQGASE